jgi:hypothetical protein
MWEISNNPHQVPCSHLKGSSASWQIAASALANTMGKGQSPAFLAVVQVTTEDQNQLSCLRHLQP